MTTEQRSRDLDRMCEDDAKPVSRKVTSYNRKVRFKLVREKSPCTVPGTYIQRGFFGSGHLSEA